MINLSDAGREYTSSLFIAAPVAVLNLNKNVELEILCF
jgi:hypothetical protein